MESCYSKFSSSANKDAIRTAIWSVVPGAKSTIEKSFLSMFAGLESLVLDFRRRDKLERVLPKPEWKKLKDYLKKCINQCEVPKLDEQKCALIHDKLEELNKISLRYAFEQFCSKYKIDLSDLWPIFNSVDGSLSNIRNKLIHGDPLPPALQDILWAAHSSLRFSMERILISILGWPVDKSEVNKDFLRKYSTA